MHKVFINGSSGTTGLRLRERLIGRSDVELIEIDPELRKDETEAKRIMESADFCFLCLPDEAARRAAELAEGTRARVIDASTAHRTMPGWIYGFPELPGRREEILGSGRVAVPGCHASGFVALIYPLADSGTLSDGYPISCTSITGYSGGGKEMISEYGSVGREPEFYSPRLYGTGQTHKHLPEMMKICGLSSPPAFMPIVANYYSGMLVFIALHARLLKRKTGRADIWEIYAEYYNKPGLVRLMPSGFDGFMESEKMSGRDDMEIFVMGNDELIILGARYDNLGKGASGAAVQCFNLMSGAPEEFGLVVGKDNAI